MRTRRLTLDDKIAVKPSQSPNSGTFGGHRRSMLPHYAKTLMNRLLLRVFRERRRLAFVVAMAFSAGALMYLNHPGQVLGMPVPLFTGSVYALFVGAAALLTSLIVPRLRFTIELVAISRLLFSIAVLYAPELTEPMRASPFISATIVVGGAAWVQILLSRNWALVAPARAALDWLDDAIGRRQDALRFARA